MNWYNSWKTIWKCLKKLKNNNYHVIQHMYLMEMKSLPWRDICTPRFIAALFTTVKTGEEPVSIDTWISNCGVCLCVCVCVSMYTFNGIYIYMSIHTMEKEMATHSSNLAWRIPWTKEPGWLQSMGLQRVRHDWTTIIHNGVILFTH